MNIEDNGEAGLDPIEIEIEDIQKTDDDDIVIEAAPEPKEEPKVIDADDGIDALKKQLESERVARQEAERRAQEYASSAYQYQNEVQDSNLTLVNNAIDTLKRNQEILKSNFRAAMENSDFDAVAEIQQDMADTSAKLMQLEQGKQQLEQAPRPEYPAFTPADPVEALASQLTPRSADWVRQHPEYATDNRLYQKMIAAHNLVTADGIRADTDDYFDAIERTLGVSESPPPPRQNRPSAPPAAPVSRSGAAPGKRANSVTLSSAEREMADMMGMTEKEYAKNKLALQREGKLH